MVLVDTSIWISHFRKGEPRLQKLLRQDTVCCHPFILGELACGNLQNREQILSLLQELPQAEVAEQDEFLLFIEKHQLMGKGLGFVDVHLLVSAMLTQVFLWTADKALRKSSEPLGIFYKSF